MSRDGKVIVAMSGGVDSSVAACLLKEQGYDCVGVFMRVGVTLDEPSEVCPREGGTEGRDRRPENRESKIENRPVRNPQLPRQLKHGCCSARDALDARAVAGRLGIPFYALNFQKDFDHIISYFVDEYANARTPNPCVLCNIQLKFGKLLGYADLLDAEFVATGHYARVLRRDGHALLARSLNRAKDQSYVLFGIRREDLPRCLFPVGEIADKAQVRRIAEELGLRVHDKPDSQEICFVPDDDYKQLVRQRRPETQRAGEIRDAAGNVLGAHDGVASYTVGQRRGLRLAVGHAIYVTNLDAATNTVTVGPREQLLSAGLVAERINWLTDPPTEPIPASIKIRHMHTPAPGCVCLRSDGNVEAVFDEPQPAVTPGQAVVFYADGIVLGGGWIREAQAQD